MPQMHHRELLIATLLLALVSIPALGAVYTWDGGGSGNSWQIAVNWSGDTVPPLTGSHDIDIDAGECYP